MTFNILGFFQKNEYFCGYKDFVDIFSGSSQNRTFLGSHFYAFKVLFLRLCAEQKYFFGVAKIQIFLGVCRIPDFFMGKERMLGPSLQDSFVRGGPTLTTFF